MNINMMGRALFDRLQPIFGRGEERAPHAPGDGNWIRKLWFEIFNQHRDREEHKGEFERVTLEDWKRSALELEAQIKARRENDIHATGEYMRILAENEALIGYRALIENRSDLHLMWVRRQAHDELARELSLVTSQRDAYSGALAKMEEDWKRLFHLGQQPAPVKAKRAHAKKPVRKRKATKA